MNGVNRFNIHRDYGNKDRLPSSHTCFNRKFPIPALVVEDLRLTSLVRTRSSGV
jgi:E3 ubiquitin-protein ligase HUWE1